MVTTEALSISPYVGPRPFEAADRGAFFGRAGEVSRLVSEVIANPTVLVYAVSGAGKTSLLAAGLAPALIEQGFEALPLARVGGGAPPPDAANAFVYCALQSIAHAGPADRADSPPRIDETLAERLAALPKGSDELGFPRPRVIVFDQFEELFTFHEDRWQERHGFFAQVAAALDQEPELRVVFSLREEYLAQLERYADQVPGAFRARFHLGRLRRKAAVQAVICPLQASNKHFAPGVAERLVDDLGQSRVSARAGQPVTCGGGSPPIKPRSRLTISPPSATSTRPSPTTTNRPSRPRRGPRAAPSASSGRRSSACSSPGRERGRSSSRALPKRR